MSQFVTGNPDLCFFEQNPELKYISEFKELINSKGIEIASKILWCVYMIEDPKSKIFRMSRKDKIYEIQNNYYLGYDDEVHKKVFQRYSEICLEKEEKLYNIHVEKLDDLTSFLEGLDIKKDKEFIKYIRIMDKLPKIWDGLEKVKSKMIEKINKTNIRGGAKQSARENRQ